jgi:hypothetical protein
MTAYNETCAAIGNDYWNHRLFLLTGDAKYLDVMERTLYNGLLSGVSLDGKLFFYPNPLESNGQHQRSPWFGVACCPGNVTRFVASFPGYMYAQRDDSIYVNLYAAGTAGVTLADGRKVQLVQQTRYPWDGAVKITVDPEKPEPFTVKVRIPGWARGEVVPSDLYRFANTNSAEPSLKVNGRAVPLKLDKGFVAVTREWKKGDVIDLGLPMPVRRVVAHEQVAADRGRVALQRGPLVYCAEWPDNPSGKVRNLMLADGASITAEWKPDLLNGVTILKSKATTLSYDAKGAVTKMDQEFTAIPYHVWANRGPGQMVVWIPNTVSSVRPTPFPTLATNSKVTASGRKNAWGVNDGEEPVNSAAPGSYFDWWPARGSTEWVEYTFEKPVSVSESQVYWFDDTGRGQVRVPASWRILYRDGGEWKPVEATAGYGLAKDTYNKVTFKPVTTSGLRLEVTMQPKWSAGIQEWKVK